MSVTTIYKCDACGCTKEFTDQGPPGQFVPQIHDTPGWGALDIGNGLDVSFMLCDGCVAKVAAFLKLELAPTRIPAGDLVGDPTGMFQPGTFQPRVFRRRRVAPLVVPTPAPPPAEAPAHAESAAEQPPEFTGMLGALNLQVIKAQLDATIARINDELAILKQRQAALVREAATPA